MNRRRACFRFDASQEIGCGHAYRCLTFTHALQALGWDISLAVGPDTTSLIDLTQFSVISLPTTISLEIEAAFIGDNVGKVDMLVVDHYERDASFERACRKWADTIFVIDDLADRSHDCEFLLDQTLGRILSEYSDLVPSRCQLLLGTDYALLRPQFPATRIYGFHDSSHAKLNNIVVSLGGTDPLNLIAIVLSGIRISALNCHVDAILGADSKDLELDKNVSAHNHVSDMATLLSKADLAIGAAGTSSWERCCLGLPTLLLITADNQRVNAERLFSSGAVYIMGERSNIDPNTIAAILRRISSRPDKLEVMRQNARRICDGLGMGRLLCEINPIVLPNGMRIDLRKATPDDREQIFAWQNEPNARRYMRRPDPPTSEEHCQWFANTLNDPTRNLNMIIANGKACGIVRVDANKSNKHLEISILIPESHRGQGIGTAALRLLGIQYYWTTLYAEIYLENLGSCRAFESAGFTCITPGVYCLHPKVTIDG